MTKLEITDTIDGFFLFSQESKKTTYLTRLPVKGVLLNETRRWRQTAV